MRLHKTLAFGLAVMAMAPAATANEYTAGALTITHPWARATPPRAPVAGGYVTITNIGSEADRLLGGSTGSAREIEIHNSTMSDGIARMRRVENGIVIAPGATLELRPGAAHIMFISPHEPLKAGNRFPATLTFETAGDVAVEFEIVPMGATPEKGADHKDDGTGSQ